MVFGLLPQLQAVSVPVHVNDLMLRLLAQKPAESWVPLVTALKCMPCTSKPPCFITWLKRCEGATSSNVILVAWGITRSMSSLHEVAAIEATAKANMVYIPVLFMLLRCYSKPGF